MITVDEYEIFRVCVRKRVCYVFYVDVIYDRYYIYVYMYMIGCRKQTSKNFNYSVNEHIVSLFKICASEISTSFELHKKRWNDDLQHHAVEELFKWQFRLRANDFSFSVCPIHIHVYKYVFAFKLSKWLYHPFPVALARSGFAADHHIR